MKWKLGVILFLLLSLRAWAIDSFVVQDIQVFGLQRISLGTVFNYLPLSVGEEVNDSKASSVLRELYKTGFFEDVQISREQDVLLIHVEERPSIAGIRISGNKELKTEELEEALKFIGLSEGRIFNPSLLGTVEQELHRQYFSRGQYGVKIEASLKPLARNRVRVTIEIDEGDPAKISLINIIGAEAFSERVLLDEFVLSTPTIWSAISDSGKYNKQEFLGDLEILRSYYMDSGYALFNIDSTQVSITPDKRNVYININISEGEQHTFGDVKITGDLVVPAEELRSLIEIKAGDIYSQRVITEANNKISERLGVDGYAFANINAIPDIDEETHTVGLTFFVDPGKRVYVRRINIGGNTITQDEILRREVRQMEGGWLSTPLVDRSKIRLQKLGFFDSVNVETLPVADTTDQVDINFDVVEGSTGSFTAGIGYGTDQGVLLNLGVTLNNFLGTGKRVGGELKTSKITNVISFNYTNPYYTPEGISRGFSVDHRTTDADEANLATFNTDTTGARVNYGIPINEFDRFSWSIGFETTDLRINNATAPIYYSDWVAANGTNSDTLVTSFNWSHDTRNRALFPDRGYYSRIGGEVVVPGSDLQYYKLNVSQRWYKALSKKFTMVLNADLGYGAAYGSTSELPFYKNYYAGGVKSVRGFVSNTLGPRDTLTNEAIGGTRKLITGAEILLPIPLFGDEERSRVSLFVDAGNVFGPSEDIALDELRASYGFSAIWITPVGPLSFNWGWPLREKEGDQTELFRFSIGAPF